MPKDMEDEVVEKRCVPTSQWAEVRSMDVKTWRTVNPMAVRMQRTSISLMAVGTRLSTKMQKTDNLMAVGAQ